MPYPFPGMNPYLERPGLWPGVHNGLIAAIQIHLAPRVRPRYYVSIEERVYLAELDKDEPVGRPDVAVMGFAENGADTEPEPKESDSSVLTVQVPLAEEVRETYLEVRETGTDYVVAVLEVLSPTNKRPGRGRLMYEEKRMDVLATRTHLVEIDLTRAWEPMPVSGNGKASDYRILVSRGNRRPNATLYAFGVRQPIPTFSLPLRPKDKEPTVDMGALIHDLYDRAGYDLRLDYTTEPVPPLASSDADWANELLREKGLR